MKITINRFINFHAILFCKYFDRNLDKKPKEKKNKNEAVEAPIPK